MRKAVTFVLAFLFAMSSIFAGRLYLAPMQGSFGVNLASDKYHVNLTGVMPSHTGTILDGVKNNGEYCDESMIAGGILDNAGQNKTATVTITSPTGFNFVSQSNPAFVRPFGIAFISKRNNRHGGVGSDSGGEYIGLTMIDGSSRNTFTLDTGNYSSVWFDAVLVLPGELSSDNNSINIDGKLYPLVDAEDYISTVTITIESESVDSGKPKKISISIPFSGFFDSDDTEKLKLENAMNISVQPTAAASNLDIKTLASTHEAKKVADIEMYYYVGSVEAAPTNPPRMFLSANNDPFSSMSDGFELLHTSVGYDTPHTSYNSIGYIVSSQSYTREEAERVYSLFEHGEDTLNQGHNVVFHGDEYTDSAGTTLYNSDDGENGFLFPRLYYSEAFESTETANYRYYYYYWKNGIYVILDSMTSGIMYPGLYRDTIYFHVIYD